MTSRRTRRTPQGGVTRKSGGKPKPVNARGPTGITSGPKKPVKTDMVVDTNMKKRPKPTSGTPPRGGKTQGKTQGMYGGTVGQEIVKRKSTPPRPSVNPRKPKKPTSRNPRSPFVFDYK